jgi:ubiquinone/menaquinone biosynthesis C-methylase UbiE
MSHPLDSNQTASAAQFDRQSANYGKSHILADTADVEGMLQQIAPSTGRQALDIATGGGHTALCLARHGYEVTICDISTKMLDNAGKLLAETGFAFNHAVCPAEALAFGNETFDLVACRVAAHHFSSPERFVREVTRVLRPGGWFLLIDGSVPDDEPETEAWLHNVEKLRDPSHGRFLSRLAWEALVADAGLLMRTSRMHPRKQPNLKWYFGTAGTSKENRKRVLQAIRTAPGSVKKQLRLTVENDGKIVWWWPILNLLARKEEHSDK